MPRDFSMIITILKNVKNFLNFMKSRTAWQKNMFVVQYCRNTLLRCLLKYGEMNVSTFFPWMTTSCLNIFSKKKEILLILHQRTDVSMNGTTTRFMSPVKADMETISEE